MRRHGAEREARELAGNWQGIGRELAGKLAGTAARMARPRSDEIDDEKETRLAPRRIVVMPE